MSFVATKIQQNCSCLVTIIPIEPGTKIFVFQIIVQLNSSLRHIIVTQAFCCLPSLSALDLSFNPLKRMEADTFAGVRNHLEELKIANTSLTLLPSFQLPMLKTLNVSSNHLTFVPPNTLGQLGCAVSKLEHLKFIDFFAYYRTKRTFL